MLIGNSSKRPDLKTIRHIKQVLCEVLELPKDTIITISELACMEDSCAPFETVFGVLRRDEPQLQYKIHKSVKDINAQDLAFVCSKWGFEVHISAIESLFKLNHTTRI
jgi:hypothetical protein